MPEKSIWVGEAELMFTFIDLFAGIGGFRKGFESIGGSCVFTSEWDKFSVQTYLANYNCEDHTLAGDITKIPAKDIPEHDVLLAGFPCQPFSLAGVPTKEFLGQAHGFRCETQGTLFFEVARILAAHRPKIFVLENVKNLLTHDKGRTFQVIRDTLVEDLGYHVSWRVIDAKAWLPQHRERIFIVGFREPTSFDMLTASFPDPAGGPVLKAILHPEDGTEPVEERFTGGELATVLPRYTLTDGTWEWLQKHAQKHRARGAGFGYGLVGPNNVARTLSARYHKDGSEILVDQGAGRNPRRLTPRECSRLMGFGEDFVIPVSDTQAYRQFGNSVAVPVVEAIANQLRPWLDGKTLEC